MGGDTSTRSLALPLSHIRGVAGVAETNVAPTGCGNQTWVGFAPPLVVKALEDTYSPGGMGMDSMPFGITRAPTSAIVIRLPTHDEGFRESRITITPGLKRPTKHTIHGK